MKKAQVEILGLMIIMVLISLGVLFAVKYVFLAPKSDIKQEFSQKNIAENMLDVMLDTDVQCNSNYISIQNLLIDCKSRGPIGSINCAGSYSCNFVERKINSIFQETLIKWGNDFYFKADTVGIGSECEKGKKTGIQPLPYDLEIRLEICD